MYFKNQTAGLGLLAVLVVTCTCNSPSVVEAIKENNTLELTRHLKHGVSPNATLPDGNGRYSGWPLLAVACSEGNVDIARLLIQAGAEVNEMVGDSYVFPLGLAIHQKNRELVKLLISSGAKFRHVTNPLSYAVLKGDYESIAVLSANPENFKQEPRAALNFAVLFRDDKAIRLLLKNLPADHEGHSANRSPIMKAIHMNDLQEFNRLLKKGSPIEEGAYPSGFYSYTPLLAAARLGRITMAKALLEKGANPNVCHRDIGTPCNLAIEYGDTKMLELLLKNGADPNYKKWDQPLPLS